jgi:hypothetical protein
MKLLVLLAMVGSAIADAQVTCETSDGSPSTEDVTGVINQLKGRKTSYCGQSNNYGSKCTTHATDGTAKIAVCGDFDSAAKDGPVCGIVAECVNAVQQQCMSNGKVGGYYTLANSNNMRFVVSHT